MYAERKGIIRKCVLALKTVIDAGYDYAVPESAEQSFYELKKENDSVLMFIDECVIKRPIEGFVDNCTTKVMYDVYKEWYKENRLFEESNIHLEIHLLLISVIIIQKSNLSWCKTHIF